MGQHVKRLEHEPQFLPTQPRGGIVIQRRNRATVDDHVAAIGVVKAGDQVEQRGFADARIAHDRDKFPGQQREIELREHDAAMAVLLAQSAAFKCWNDNSVAKRHALSKNGGCQQVSGKAG